MEIQTKDELQDTIFFIIFLNKNYIYKYTQVLPEVRTLPDNAGPPEMQCHIYPMNTVPVR